MNKPLCLILALLLSLCIPLAACAEAADSPRVSAEQAIMDQLLGAMGEDLVQRARDGGYQLKVSFSHGRSKYATDATQSREDISVEIDIRSPMGSTMYKSNTVDCDLLAELEAAAVTSGIFALSEEEAEQFLQHRYTTDTRYADVYSEDDCVNLLIDETPSSEAIVMLRHWFPDWKNIYILVRSSQYGWDGLEFEVDF